MTSIFAPVGKNVPSGKGNFANDVRAVQTLLNNWIEHGSLQGHVEKLTVDGDCGNFTKGAIKSFQTIVLGWQHPDSRIDPNGVTFKELTGPRAPKAGSKLPPSTSPIDYNPVEIPPHTSANFRTGGETSIWLISSKVMIRSGEVWKGNNGYRLIVSASYDGVCFVQLSAPRPGVKPGALYCQHRLGFQQDIGIGAVASDIADHTQTVRRLIELEMHFMIGLGAATGGTIGWIFMMGTGIGKFIAENEKKFPKWVNAISVALTTRRILKQYAPTFYEKVIDSLMLGTWKGLKIVVMAYGTDIASNIPEAMISKSDQLAKATGALVGKLGKAGWLGKTTVVYAVLIILIEAASLAIKSSPLSVKLTAQEVISKLRAAEVAITEAEGKKIVEEIIKHALILRPELQKLQSAIEQC